MIFQCFAKCQGRGFPSASSPFAVPVHWLSPLVPSVAARSLCGDVGSRSTKHPAPFPLPSRLWAS